MMILVNLLKHSTDWQFGVFVDLIFFWLYFLLNYYSLSVLFRHLHLHPLKIILLRSVPYIEFCIFCSK